MGFESLTGFREESPDQVRGMLEVRGDRLLSRANQWSMVWGRLETPSLAELDFPEARAFVPPGFVDGG